MAQCVSHFTVSRTVLEVQIAIFARGLWHVSPPLNPVSFLEQAPSNSTAWQAYNAGVKMGCWGLVIYAATGAICSGKWFSGHPRPYSGIRNVTEGTLPQTEQGHLPSGTSTECMHPYLREGPL